MLRHFVTTDLVTTNFIMTDFVTTDFVTTDFVSQCCNNVATVATIVVTAPAPHIE